LNTVNQIVTLIKKEFTLDFRDKNPLFSLLVYVIGIGVICYLAFVQKGTNISTTTWNALFWINIFFISQLAISKSFFSESKDRDFYYFFTVKPEAVIISKIIYNWLFIFCLALVSLMVFLGVFRVNTSDTHFGWFILNLLSGSIGLSAGQSLLAGIASKTNNNATLMAVLSVPVISPLLLFMLRISNNAIEGIDVNILKDLLSMNAVNVIIITVSYFLFPYLWRS